MTTTTKLSSVLVLAVTASCTGVINSSSEDERDPSEGEELPGGRSGGSRGDGGKGGTDVVAAIGPLVATPLRLLTRDEYKSTVRDLLGLDVTVTFTPEEETYGFKNNAMALTVSPVLAEQLFTSAQALASVFVAKQPPACATKTPNEACAREFIVSIGKRAWRRPLADGEVTELMTLHKDAASSSGFESGLQASVANMLMSPHFLFRVELPAKNGMRPSSWEMASRLSYGLLGTMPDADLFAEAERDRLRTDGELTLAAKRLINDPRAVERTLTFFADWLDLERIDRLQKSSTQFPTFSREVAVSMRREVDEFVRQVAWGANGTLTTLFTSPRTFLDGTLRAFHDLPPAKGPELSPLELPGRRAGLFTQTGLLAMLASQEHTSPTLRGKWVRQQLLCEDLPPPPPDASDATPSKEPKNARERVEQHAADPGCKSCHKLMDPIGFGFEKYDAGGRWRDEERGQPIDDDGEVVDSPIGRFKGVAELAGRVAKDPATAKCFARGWFRYAAGRKEAPSDAGDVENMANALETGTLRDLALTVSQTRMFREQGR